MDEHFVKLYRKEEQFLDDFSGCAMAAAKLLGEDWIPHFHANDDTRHNQAYFLKSDELHALAFHSAAIYHDKQGGFSSVQIVLCSSTRQVTVRVAKNDTGLTATKVVDRRPPA